MSDVQPFGDRLQASQFDDLRPLEGGKSARAPGSGRRGHQSGQPLPLVASAGSPDSGLVALHLKGHRAVMHAPGVGQDDASTPDLVPGQGIASGDLLEDGPVGRSDGDEARLSSRIGPPRIAGQCRIPA